MSIFSKIKPTKITDENPHKHDALCRGKRLFFIVDFIKGSNTPFKLAVEV